MQPGGAHNFLAQLVGDWSGTMRLWLEPGQLTDEQPTAGSVRSILGGRFVLHEYSGVVGDTPASGLAIHGYDLAEQRFVTAWVDSWHNGTAIMLSCGDPAAWPGPASVLGSYPDGQGGPRWGWRTLVELPGSESLMITHYNITPEGEEAKAVEWDYKRA